MTAHQHITITCLALLLGLTACAPASPVAPAPTAPPAARLQPVSRIVHQTG